MLEPALVQMGLPKSTAALLIEMWKGANAGLIAPLEQRTAKNTTPTTLESFASGSLRAGVSEQDRGRLVHLTLGACPRKHPGPRPDEAVRF